MEESTDEAGAEGATGAEEKLKLIKETSWIPHQLNHGLDTGKMQNLSMRLTRFLNEYEE